MEARTHAHEYASILIAGPDPAQVQFQHHDHLIVTFDDVENSGWTEYNTPTLEQVRQMVTWGRGRQNLLVVCNSGVSRSTAAAWGVAIANGWNAEEAYSALRERHPSSAFAGWRYTRQFSPNELMILHLEKIFGYRDGELLEMHRRSQALNPWRPARPI